MWPPHKPLHHAKITPEFQLFTCSLPAPRAAGQNDALTPARTDPSAPQSLVCSPAALARVWLCTTAPPGPRHCTPAGSTPCWSHWCGPPPARSQGSRSTPRTATRTARSPSRAWEKRLRMPLGSSGQGFCTAEVLWVALRR